MKAVISLTSIPPRFKYLEKTLNSLVQQNPKMGVFLYIPLAYKRFPDWDGTLPAVPDGVSIVRTDWDLGPATKVLFAAKQFSGKNIQILFCDDDGVHKKGWAKRLLDEQLKRPNEAIATWGRDVSGYLDHKPEYSKLPRVKSVSLTRDLRYRFERVIEKLFARRPVKRPTYKAGYCDIFFGVGGVVVKPEFFDDLAFDIPDVAWLVDDIWLSAMLARRGIFIYCPKRMPMPLETEASIDNSLLDLDANNELGGRQTLNKKAAEHCFKEFHIWSR